MEQTAATTNVGKAINFLAHELQAGEPPTPARTLAEAASEQGISEKSLRSARERLEVKVEQKEGAWWWSMPTLAEYGGLRRGELRALRWGDLDLPGRVIHVARAWDDVEGEQTTKSKAGERRVPILDPLARELAAHKLRSGRDGDALVFGRTADEPFVLTTVRRRALTAWKDAELLPIMLHEARHTCASLLIASGANAKAISEVMGHASITMTFDTYGHLMPGAIDEVAAAANAYLEREAMA